MATCVVVLWPEVSAGAAVEGRDTVAPSLPVSVVRRPCASELRGCTRAAGVGILSGVGLAEPLAVVARGGAFTSRALYAAEWFCGCWECSMTSSLPLTLMTVSTGVLELCDCSKASEEGALGVCRASATEVSDISVRTAVFCVGADVFLVGAAKGREGAWRLSARSFELLAIAI